MANTLLPGEPRVGFCVDEVLGDPYPAMLHDTGEEVELTVSFYDDETLRRRFIGRGAHWGDDPDYSRYRYGVPDTVWFFDTHGHMCLLQPYRRRSTGLGSVMQEGSAAFRYAVATGDKGLDYGRVNAMRTTIQGLDEWIPLGSISLDRSTADGRRRYSLVIESPPEVRISRTLNARLEGWYQFSVSQTPGQTELNDRVHVRTDVSRPRDLADHLDISRGVQQLVRVAGWQPYGIDHVEVQRRRDPVTALSGQRLDDRWAPVFTHNISPATTINRGRFLFDFDDVGAAGVRRWFALREDFGAGIAGMIHSIGHTDAALETLFSEAAAAMEHIGYRIAVEKNETPTQRLRTHLRRMTREITVDLGFDLDAWVLRLADYYRRVKHPEHQTPDSLDLLNTLRESQLVFRVWVALRLGAKPALVRRNLPILPMSRPYERL